MIEVDHGNDLITRYAHSSEVFVKKGDLIKRGQKIATVGTTGRSTGPHLHFEVLVQGVPQDPQKFLTAGKAPATAQIAQTALAKAASTAMAPKPLITPNAPTAPKVNVPAQVTRPAPAASGATSAQR
jgi:pyruvate/2-oxoglutarate dehydrogenase complex dihydrolipoamide acyltransferase (E2) component